MHKGDKGGFIESEHNLSQGGNCWVYDNAYVYDSAKVYGSANVYVSAKVYGSANIQSAADYIYIKGLGSEYRGTTVFRDRNYGVAVKCGCFLGSLAEFEKQVKETHGDSKFAAEYLKLVELIKIHFKEEINMKTFKGFNKDLTCRGFQYEVGKTYEEDKAEVCYSGFHACEYPLDCFSYYPPNSSVYHVVEQTGELSKDGYNSKVASSQIKIGEEVGIHELVKAAIEYTTSFTEHEDETTGAYGAASATGAYGAASATGAYGAASATGDYGAASATGDRGAASATGECGAASATGNCGAASVEQATAIAIAWGCGSKAKGVIGSFLVISNWEKGSLKGAKMVQVDGENIKPNTYYTMKDGEIIEAYD